jgi:hypothetical protein
MLQAQVKAPGVFVHVACGSHGVMAPEHSLVSVHVVPSPMKPMLHAHVKLPGVLVHVAFGSQLAVPVAHSSTSLHVMPFPV